MMVVMEIIVPMMMMMIVIIMMMMIAATTASKQPLRQREKRLRQPRHILSAVDQLFAPAQLPVERRQGAVHIPVVEIF